MSLEFFFRSLPEHQRDGIIAIVSETHAEDSQARIDSIERDIETIRVRLDEMHAQREALKDRVTAIDAALTAIESKGSTELEVAGLKLWLTNLRSDLRVKIAAFHPESDLRAKLELVQKLSDIKARREFAQRLAQRLLIPIHSSGKV